MPRAVRGRPLFAAFSQTLNKTRNTKTLNPKQRSIQNRNPKTLKPKPKWPPHDYWLPPTAQCRVSDVFHKHPPVKNNIQLHFQAVAICRHKFIKSIKCCISFFKDIFSSGISILWFLVYILLPRAFARRSDDLFVWGAH